MSIQFETNRLAGAAQMSAQDLSTPQNTGKALAALLGGASVTVTNGGMGDLEALVARLKNENERTRFSMMLTSLVAMSQSLDENQKQRLEQGLALSEKLDELQKSLDKYRGEEAEAKAAALLLQAKIEQLQKQIEQAVQDGKDHNANVEEQTRVREAQYKADRAALEKELKEAKADLAAREQTVTDLQGKITTTKNEIASVKGKISAIVNTIGENTLKTIANEIAALAAPEKAERPAETAKAEEKELLNDPLNAIRDSLAMIERDLAETIEQNRIETV